VSLVTAVLPWLLPPACGALAGYGIGRLASRALAQFVTTRLLAVPLSAIVPRDGSPAALSLERSLAGVLATFLGSRGTIYAVREAVSNLVAGIGGRKVSDVSREFGLTTLLADKVLPAVLAAAHRTAISRAMGEIVARQAGTVLDNEVLREVSVAVESHLPGAAEALVRWLRSPETRVLLSERGRELLPRILEKLSEMQRLFISAGQFDRRLNEKMPEIIDETIEAVEKVLRDPHQQERIAALLLDSARDWRDSLLVTAADSPRPWNDARQKLSDSASRLLGHLLERLDNAPARQAIAESAVAGLGQDHRTVAAFFRDTFGVADSQVGDAISSRVLSFLTRPESAQQIARRLCALVFEYAQENDHAAEKHLLPVLGEALAKNRRLGAAVGVFGAAIGLVVGTIAMALRLID
jgi:hypothetical protein